MSERAIDGAIATPYTPSACADATNSIKTPKSASAGPTFPATEVKFKAKIRGTDSEKQGTICDINSSSCKLAAKDKTANII